eukprot:5571222-Lingulodinium_polyedra.AAC.1
MGGRLLLPPRDAATPEPVEERVPDVGAPPLRVTLAATRPPARGAVQARLAAAGHQLLAAVPRALA